MLVDLEHMSDRTIDAIIRPGGAAWSLGSGRACIAGQRYRRGEFVDTTGARVDPATCFANAYPLMSSHTNFRGQSLTRTNVKDFKAREFERTPEQIEFIRLAGGTIAPMVGHDPIVRPPTRDGGGVFGPSNDVLRGVDGALRTNPDSPALNDCAGSSKSWITAYLYGVQKMHGAGVGLSTDMALVGATGPRFEAAHPAGYTGPLSSCPSSGATALAGIDSLWALTDVPAALRRGQLTEEDLYREQYDRAAQRNRVATGYSATGRFVWPHRTPAGGTFDFNTEGMTTYGGLPELLQDALNAGVDRRDLDPLFHSAQSYLDMWTKAFRLPGCVDARGSSTRSYEQCAGTGPAALDERRVCRNTCPDDPGRGHRLLPDGRPLPFR